MEMGCNDLRKNAEGYSDPTAYEAMKILIRMMSGFTSCYILFFIFASWQGSRLRAESFWWTRKMGEFGDDEYEYEYKYKVYSTD